MFVRENMENIIGAVCVTLMVGVIVGGVIVASIHEDNSNMEKLKAGYIQKAKQVCTGYTTKVYWVKDSGKFIED